MPRPLDSASVPARLRELRHARGLSLRQVAARSGISKSEVWAIENGEHQAGVETLARLTGALDMTVMQFLGGADLDGIEERGRFPDHELARAGRGRRVLAGEGMLKCVRSFTFEGQRFHAGGTTTLVAPDHPAANAHPECFEVSYDRESSPEVLRWVERQIARLGGEPKRGNRDGLYGERPRPKTDWKL